MRTCVICHFQTDPDDVVLANGHALCVCLRCYSRETGTERPMPKELRRALISVLAAVA